LKNEINFTSEKNKNVKVEEGNMTFYSMFGIIFVLFVKILMEQNSFFDSVLSFIIIFLLIYFFYQTNHDKK
jgi:predicted permease